MFAGRTQMQNVKDTHAKAPTMSLLRLNDHIQIRIKMVSAKIMVHDAHPSTYVIAQHLASCSASGVLLSIPSLLGMNGKIAVRSLAFRRSLFTFHITVGIY